MKGEVITVGTSRTEILGGNGDGTAGAGSSAYPSSGIIRIPAGSVTVYLGGSNVDTTTNGVPFVAGEDLEVDVVNEILYGDRKSVV